ncbi:MAG: Stp1/IreP family PP2C-type Ser/Thr phosphatase [Myxococcaceae bacterium]|nr:Stp1/IreP family PP2C-type Ser/Thr phosphatase [Myxococcaceae bacterium]
MYLEVAGKTDVGRKRDHNEDNFILVPEENVFCVADGMGGHSSGEVASQIAVTEIAEFFRMTSDDDEVTWPFKMDRERSYDENRISVAIKLANVRIFETSQRDSRKRGMGTTVVAIYCKDEHVFVAHVGDSRVYRYIAAERRLEQITEDHSLLNDYIRARKLSPEEIANFPHKNVIVRALGMKDNVVVDVARVSPAENDVFLLCSDGLSGMINDAQMQEILRTEPDLARATEKMIAGANAAGGVDNVTCVLARWHEAEGETTAQTL